MLKKGEGITFSLMRSDNGKWQRIKGGYYPFFWFGVEKPESTKFYTLILFGFSFAIFCNKLPNTTE